MSDGGPAWLRDLIETWRPQPDGTIVVHGLDDLSRSNLPWIFSWYDRYLELRVGPFGQWRFEVIEYRSKPVMQLLLRPIPPEQSDASGE